MVSKILANKIAEIRREFTVGVIITVVLAIFIDQLLKYLTYHYSQGFYPVVITPIVENYFNIVHYRNKGASWGIFSEYTQMLAILSITASIYIVYNFKELSENNQFRRYCFALILGGILGNWVDRQFFVDGVIDMIEFFIPLPDFISMQNYQFPAFNIADSCITGGFLLLCVNFIAKKIKFYLKKK